MASNEDTNGGEFSDELLALSRKHWHVEGKKKQPKFQAKVVDQIFQGLSERSFPLRELVVLDQSLYLEKYLSLELFSMVLTSIAVICGPTSRKRRLISLFCQLPYSRPSKLMRMFQYGV
jgi:Intron-binding protein aquarius N-terminus